MVQQGFRYWFDRPPFDGDDLRIRGLGYREWMRPGMVDRPHGTGDVLIMRWHQRVRLTTRSGEGRHPPGTVVLWPSGAGHRYGAPEGRWSHSWLHCEGRRVQDWIREGLVPCQRALELGAAGEAWEDCLLALHRELRGPYRPSARIAGNLIETCLLQLGRHLRRDEPRVADAPLALREAKHAIETRFQEPLRLGDLAALAGYSVPRFGALFRRHFDASPMAYLTAVRMQRAAYLLRDRELPVAEVARRVGYDDPAWFSRHFKQHHGRSPRAWRTAAVPS